MNSAANIKAARGDAEHPTNRFHRIAGLVRCYEPEDLPGVVSVSRANQAVAFAKISRSPAQASPGAARSAAWRAPQDCGWRRPARSFSAGTPGGRQDDWGIVNPLQSQIRKCPRKRVNSTFEI